MKNKKIIPWILFTTFISTASCVVGVTDNTSTTKIYRYVNESGVEVALVGEVNDNFEIPDSLVILNGDTKEYSFGWPDMDGGKYPSFPYKRYDSSTIPPTEYSINLYFNKNKKMTYYPKSVYNDKDLRNPFYLTDDISAYVLTTREEKKQKHIKTINTYTYTFTAEDYQNAIKAQDNTGKL